MKVLDLQCRHHHVFEGWFGSEDDFQHQLAHGLIACPLCADVQVSKKLSAPRLNLHVSRGEVDSSEGAPSTDVNARLPDHATSLAGAQEVSNLAPAQLQAALLKMVRHVVAQTEDVGDDFPEEARKIHYGETEARNIRGHATPEETHELLEEGIAVMPLLVPDGFKEPLQ